MRPRIVVTALAVALTLTLALLTRTAHADTISAARGESLLTKKGCVACHSTDGSSRQGPSLRGLFGSLRAVTTGGAAREVIADKEYVARALRDPDADVVVGFPRGTMPKFPLSDDDIASLTLAIEALASPAAAPAPRGSIWLVALSSAAFVVFHLLLSSVPVRKRLIAALKPGGFAGLYSLVATGALVGMVLGFRAAPYVEIWLPPRGMRFMPLLFMPVALLFMVAGFSTRGPTSVGQGRLATEEKASLGIFSITRHPALWGFALWALSHLATNGELRAMVLFLAILALAIAGMLHIDRRRAAELGDAWAQYCERTSLVPFAAIMGGRAELDWRGIGLVRVGVAALFYVAILHTHHLTIGASPYP